MARRFPSLAALLATTLASAHVRAAITVEGVTDQEVYTNSARLRVVAAAGFDDTIRLVGEPLPIEIPVASGAWVDVTQPQFWLLSVERRNQTSGAIERREVRFIVRASERQNAEWGLPPWVPHASVPSASTEFAGATLVFVAPARYPIDLPIPVAAIVESAAGERVGVNGEVAVGALAGGPVKLLRGIGAWVLDPAATVTTAASIDYEPSIATISTSKRMDLETSPTWQSVSGTIAAGATWAADSRIRVTGDVTIPAGVTLTIGAGAVVALAGGADLTVNGKIVIQGTRERPVVFTPRDPAAPWGGFIFRSGSVGEISGALMHGACADPDWFGNNPGSGDVHLPNQCLLYMNGSTVTATDSFFFDSRGQAGHGENATFTMTRCVFQRFLTSGEYVGGSVRLDRCAVIEFPLDSEPFADDDGDGIYFTSGAHSLTNCLIGWAHDDGVDAGSGGGGSVTVENCWVEGCFHEALAWSGGSSGTPRRPTVRNTVVTNSGQGIEAGWDYPMVDAENVLLIANLVGARFGDNYDWEYDGRLDVTGSLLLHNGRDIWGRNWEDWVERLSQMDLHGNHLTAADPLHPDNEVWDPDADAALLEPFLPSPGTVVGIGFATFTDRLEIPDLANGVPVRLSRFTTVPVSVDWAVTTDAGPLPGGNLVFRPGETVKVLRPEVPEVDSRTLVRIALSGPVSCELSGFSEIRFMKSTTFTLIPQGAPWKYWDEGTFPGTGWQDASFQDASWPEGPAVLGFGDDGEVTDIDGGPDGARYTAVYFRTRFQVPDPAALETVTLRIRRDDGALVWLNGKEVARTNMPAGTIAHDTWAEDAASGSAETTYYQFAVAPADLVAGWNQIAVEVHQSDAGSSDLGFDLELRAAGTVSAEPVFVRGDSNGDRAVDISDAVSMLLVLFQGDTTDCVDSLDANDDGMANISDPIFALDFLFRGGPTVPPPYPSRGPDPTEDALDCNRS